MNYKQGIDVFPIKVGVLTGNYRLTPINQITQIPDILFPNIDSAQYIRRKQNKCKSCQSCKCLKKKQFRCNICDC